MIPPADAPVPTTRVDRLRPKELVTPLAKVDSAMGSSMQVIPRTAREVAAELGRRLYALSHTIARVFAPLPATTILRPLANRYLQCRRRGFRAFRWWGP